MQTLLEVVTRAGPQTKVSSGRLESEVRNAVAVIDADAGHAVAPVGFAVLRQGKCMGVPRLFGGLPDRLVVSSSGVGQEADVFAQQRREKLAALAEVPDTFTEVHPRQISVSVCLLYTS